MKKILLTGLFAVLIAAGFAQKPYKVVFYNFENLFDTIDDPGVNDTEFTPEGPKKWNAYKYAKKIGNLERVLFDIASADGDFPIVIGVSEVENRSVMEDVIATPKLSKGNYRIARSPRYRRGFLLPSRRLQTRRQRSHSVPDARHARFPYARFRDDVGHDRG